MCPGNTAERWQGPTMDAVKLEEVGCALGRRRLIDLTDLENLRLVPANSRRQATWCAEAVISA